MNSRINSTKNFKLRLSKLQMSVCSCIWSFKMFNEKSSAFRELWSAGPKADVIMNICVLFTACSDFTLDFGTSLSVTLVRQTPPLLSSVTPHWCRAEFTFFLNPLSSATKTLSSPDQNRPVDTSSRVPEHSLSSSAPLIGWRRGKTHRIKRRRQQEKSYLTKSSGCCWLSASRTSTASLGRDKQRWEGGSKVRLWDVWRTKHLQSEAVKMKNDL